MKKLLALVLALVMTLSLAVSASAFKDDKDVSADYAEAVAVLNGMDVFKGYEDGSFKPQGNITRAEVATIIYRIYTGDVAKNDKSGLYSTYNKFSDMTGAGWAAGYIGYCANAELVKGYPDGTFKPSGNVTGYEVLAMILRAVGYDKNNEFSGADWSLNVAKYAEQLGVLKNVDKNTNLGAPATRELVAEILFRAIQQPTVTYTPAFGYQTDKALTLAQVTLAKKNFNLDSKDSEDEWGRPSTKWYNTKTNKTYAEVVATPDASYNVATAQCDICSALGEKTSAKIVETYTNGVKSTAAVTYKATATKAMVGAQGEQIEFYELKDGGYRLVIVDTYLAYVKSVVTEKLDKNGHVDRDDYLELVAFTGVDDNRNATTSTVYVDGNDYAKDEYVLVNINAEKANNVEFVGLKGKQAYVEVVGKADSLDAAQTAIWRNANQHTIDGKDYDDACKFFQDDAKYTKNVKYTWYFDQFGNVIGSVALDRSSYAVLKDLIWEAGKPGHAEATLIAMDGKATESTVTVNTIDGFNPNDEGYGYDTDFDDVKPALYDSKNAFFANYAGSDKQTADVSVDPSNNEMYNGLALYMVETNDDGSVNLQAFDTTEDDVYAAAADEATLNIKTSAIFYGNNDKVFVTDDTQFIIRTGDGTKADPYKYEAFTGTDNLPDMADESVSVMFSTPDTKTKVVDYVYITDYTPAKLDANLLYTYTTKVQDLSKKNDPLFAMDVILDGEKATIKTSDEDIINALSDKDNLNKLFYVDIDTTSSSSSTYGEVTSIELVNNGTDNVAMDADGIKVNYLGAGVAEKSGERILDGYDAYYLDKADTKVVFADGSVGTIADLKEDDFKDNGIWVVYDSEKYLTVDCVYVGSVLDTEIKSAKLTYTYTDSSDSNKSKTATVNFVWNEETKQFEANDTMDKGDAFVSGTITVAGKNSYINRSTGNWLLSGKDFYSNYTVDTTHAKTSGYVTAEDGDSAYKYRLSWEIAEAGEKVLVSSIVDLANPSTTLYNDEGDAYKSLEDAVKNVQMLDHKTATAAKLNLAAAVAAQNPTIEYQNFSTTATIKDADLTTYAEATGIQLVNPGQYTLLKITLGSGDDAVSYYMVFQHK